MAITTRRMKLQVQLQETQKELKESQHLADRLLQERDDNEVDIRRLVDKNTTLKQQRAELDLAYNEALTQCAHLQAVVASFNESQVEHQITLERASLLETQLAEAQDELALLHQRIGENYHVKHRTSLFEELQDEGSFQMSFPKFQSSHKKIKKYIRVNKIIKKTSKLIKKNNCIRSSIPLRREKIALLSEIDTLETQLSEMSQRHDKIQVLYDELSSATNELLALEQQNRDLLCNLLDDKNISSDVVELDLSPPTTLAPAIPPIVDDGYEDSLQEKQLLTEQAISNVASAAPVISVKTVLYSDKLGSGTGLVMSNHLNHEVINKCYPGASLQQIVNNIMLNKHSLDGNTTLIVLVGNSIGLKKRDVVKCIDQLSTLQVNKIMLCAFPYSNNILSKNQNDSIHCLNTYLYTVTCHDDKFLFFDTNTCITSFNLTMDTCYVSKNCKHKMATLIAHKINFLNKNIVYSYTIKNSMSTINLNLLSDTNTTTKSKGNIQPLN